MTATSFDLTGRRALVTGASGGLGAHFATALASAGADLVLAARRVEKLEETANAVRQAGREAQVVQLDVSDYASVEKAFADMPALDVVVNNAGVNREGRTHEITEEDWDTVMNTNLKGVWAVSRFAIRQWLDAGRGGSLINIASILGLRVGGMLGPYCISKAGVVQMTQSLALDYAKAGIRCNAICPGYFETDMNRDFLQTEQGQKLLKRVPYKRTGDMSELDGPLLLLASDASSFMTGAVIPVDGGHLQSSL